MIYKAKNNLADRENDREKITFIDQHIEHIRSVLIRHGRNLKPERASSYEMAKEIGAKTEYESMYAIYSKYVHASAWFVLRNRDDIDLPMYRVPMQVNTQLYAGDTFIRLENIERGS